MTSPPPIKGGQGRTPKDIEDSAETMFWLLVVLAVLFIALAVAHFLKELT